MTPEAARRRLFGALLMAIGGLIALLCGLCSLTTLLGMTWGLLSSLASGFRAGLMLGVLWSLLLVGVVGGIPTLVGVVLFRSGQRMRRDAQPPIPVAVFGDPHDPA